MFKVVALILSVVLACQALTDEQINQEWKSFQEKNQKSYRSPVELSKRLNIFKENLEKIEAHNALFYDGKVTFKKGVTKFTDLTSEEFVQYVNKYKMTPKKAEKLVRINSNKKIAEAVDWRQKGVISAVKDQGNCGSCWAFSATGAIEAQRAIRKNDNQTLSEQNLIDCNTLSHGCSGGNMDAAFYYVLANGIDSEEDYPYEATQGVCRQKRNVAQIDTYEDLADEENIQQAVAEIGPVSVGIDATDELQNYSSGVLVDPTCSSIPNHGVLVVGYGNENGLDYWIIKNSWGSNWGDEGYFKLVRNKNACAITTMASLPIIYA